jgi:peptidoglycan/xylan/chitin deacetylase (PgdA/CDA1 family)
MSAFSLLSDRLPYVPFPQRPVLQGVGGKNLLVWVIVNVEHWSIAKAMPRTVLPPPMGQPLLPDLPNWSWHEYGMRAGFWRLLEALRQRGIVPTLATNGIVCQSYPQVAEAALKEGWEFMGHGWIQGPMHKVENQTEDVAKTLEIIRRFTGQAPRGWESPGLTETDDTIDVLSAAGIDYVADWVVDDQPTWIHGTPRPMMTVPYTVELNDIPLMAIQQHRSEELYHRGVLQVERLRQECTQNPRVMAISVHPYITGVPHRIASFEKLLDHVMALPEVAIMPGVQIADWYAAQVPPPGP